MLQPKDTGSLNGYKNKTHKYAVYKRPTSDLGTHTAWKWGDGKRYSMQMEIKRKLEWCGDHILGHKSSLSKFKKIEIISSTFSNHNAMRLEINYGDKM